MDQLNILASVPARKGWPGTEPPLTVYQVSSAIKYTIHLVTGAPKILNDLIGPLVPFVSPWLSVVK